MYKLIIAGGRDFDDYASLEKAADEIIASSGATEIEIVSGGQRTAREYGMFIGADYFGEQYAMKRGYGLKKFPADWKKHGKSAGPIRNGEMAVYGDELLVHWDRKSRGTKDMITKMEALKKPVHKRYYN